MKGLQGHICIVQDAGTEERLFLTGLQHDFLWMSLLLLTISYALLGISHLAEVLMAFQALELAAHMSPLYVTVHPRKCRCMFWLFRFVCVARLTQPFQGFQVHLLSTKVGEHGALAQVLGPGTHTGIVCCYCLYLSNGRRLREGVKCLGASANSQKTQRAME